MTFTLSSEGSEVCDSLSYSQHHKMSCLSDTALLLLSDWKAKFHPHQTTIGIDGATTLAAHLLESRCSGKVADIP